MEARILVDQQKLIKPWEDMIVVSPPPVPEPFTNHPYLYHILTFCNRFLMPAVILTGIIGNILAFLVFVFSPLKRLVTSVYLAALAVVDCSFLLCLGAGWLDNFQFSFFQQTAVCTYVVYMTYVLSFLSVWMVVCFTTDVYLTLFHEDLATKVNHVSRARLIVCTLTLLSGVLYVHTFWTTKQVKNGEDRKTCAFDADENVRMALALVDSFLTLLLPYTLLIFMNTRILLVIVKFSRTRSRGGKSGGGGNHKEAGGGGGGASSSRGSADLHLEPIDEREEMIEMGLGRTCSAGGETQRETVEISAFTEALDKAPSKKSEDKAGKSGTHRSSATRGSRKSSTKRKKANASIDGDDVTQKQRDFDDEKTLTSSEAEGELDEVDLGLYSVYITRREKKCKTMNAKINEMEKKLFKMLLTVAMIFLILNMPSHAIRLQGLLRSFFTSNYDTSPTEHICQQFFQVLYYFNFMVNFIIYNAYIKSFRTAIVSLPYMFSKACTCKWKVPGKSKKMLDSHRIGEKLRRMREKQNSRLVEMNLAELHISKIESFASDFKYVSPPCLLQHSKTEEETRM